MGKAQELPSKRWPSEAELQRYCLRWQVMLRLQQWRVKIRYARAREMTTDMGDIAWGRCRINENHLKATVTVLHPDDYEDDEGREEIESTVVHELLHLLMNGVRREQKAPDQAGDVAEEQVINVTAGLLVDLYQQLSTANQ